MIDLLINTTTSSFLRSLPVRQIGQEPGVRAKSTVASIYADPDSGHTLRNDFDSGFILTPRA
ncbi:MAG: hypothetical protein ACMZ7B_01150 [Balneola sp.]